MSPTQAVESVLRKYADFGGRASRPELWWWWGALFLAYVATGVLTSIVGELGYLLALVIAVGAFVPNLAVTVRRLHDTSRSGRWLLVVFIPVIGAFILLVFLALAGDRQQNQWGAPPASAYPSGTAA